MGFIGVSRDYSPAAGYFPRPSSSSSSYPSSSSCSHVVEPRDVMRATTPGGAPCSPFFAVLAPRKSYSAPLTTTTTTVEATAAKTTTDCDSGTGEAKDVEEKRREVSNHH